jgi:hypothetical protein
MVYQLCRPIYARRLDLAVLSGEPSWKRLQWRWSGRGL